MSDQDFLLEPLDHEDGDFSIALAFDMPVPEPYRPKGVVRLVNRLFEVRDAIRFSVGSYPTNFVTRAQWGAQPPRSRSTNISPQTGGVAWHYLGPKSGTWEHSQCAGKVRQIQAFHMGSQRGWVDIAYTALVCPHGFIYEGRGIGVRTAANGTNAGNQAYYAICGMLGEGDVLTGSMVEAFKHGTVWLREAGKAGNKVKSHNYFKPTGCPGEPARAEAAKWDGQVITVVYTPPPPAPDPTPAPTGPVSGSTTNYRNQTYPPHPEHAMPLAYKDDPTPAPEWVVKDIQAHLNYAYYDHRVNVPLLKCDGNFGPTTDARVRDWQKRAGLTVDGKVGSGTWSRLHNVTSRRRVDMTGKAF